VTVPDGVDGVAFVVVFCGDEEWLWLFVATVETELLCVSDFDKAIPVGMMIATPTIIRRMPMPKSQILGCR
jgi:hypothetical protein